MQLQLENNSTAADSTKSSESTRQMNEFSSTSWQSGCICQEEFAALDEKSGIQHAVDIIEQPQLGQKEPEYLDDLGGIQRLMITLNDTVL